MSLPAELERLAALHASGTLTDEEFAAAKAALLSGDSRPIVDRGDAPAVDALAISRQQLEEQRHANAVAQLDREWAMERESFMMTGHDGDADGHGGYPYRYRPTRAGSIIGGIVITVFGCFWTAAAASMSSSSHWSTMRRFDAMTGLEIPPPFAVFPLFGVLFILFGLWVSYQGYTKADALESAERDYKHRRGALLAGRDDPGPTEPPAAMADEEGDFDDDEGIDERRNDGIFFG